MSVLWEVLTCTVDGLVNVHSVVKQTGEYRLLENDVIRPVIKLL